MAPTLLGLSVYLWIALISLIFLIFLAVTGSYGLDVHGGDLGGDIGHDFGQFTGSGVSPLSPPLVASFGTSFGAFGGLLDLSGGSAIVTGIGAAAGAAVVTVGLFFVIQYSMVRAQTSSDVQPQELIGREAHVLVPIRNGAQGQILVITEERGRTLFPANALEEIPRDAIVEIVGFAGGVANVRKKLG